MMQSYSYALNYVFETHLIFDFKLHPLCLSQIEVLRFMVMFEAIVQRVVVLLCRIRCPCYSVYYMHTHPEMHAGAATFTCNALLNLYASQGVDATAMKAIIPLQICVYVHTYKHILNRASPRSLAEHSHCCLTTSTPFV